MSESTSYSKVDYCSLETCASILFTLIETKGLQFKGIAKKKIKNDFP